MSVPSENNQFPGLEISTLGGLRFTLNGMPLTSLTSRPAQALLVYLARRAEPVSRRTLAELIWPERTEANSLANLRVTLHRLRSLLGDVIEVKAEAVRLNGARVQIDIHILEALLSGNRLEEAVACYQGDFLAGFSLGESRSFEDWQAEEADCLRGEVLSACQRLVQQHTETGEFEQAIQSARRLLELDPFHEPTQRQLMRLLASTDQRNTALAGFERYRKQLLVQVGVDPDPATLELYAQVKANLIHLEGVSQALKEPIKVAISTAEPALPQPASALVGRQEQLAYLQAQLSNPDCRLITIIGPGGIGKTRLVLEAALVLRERFSSGVYFASLAGATSGEVFMLEFTQSLGFSPLSTGDLFQQVTQFLQRKEILVVLDNFEQLLPKYESTWGKETDSAVNLVSRLLKAAPALKLLVTSRERLRLEEEWLLPLHGLGLASEAASFFSQAARRMQQEFNLAMNLEEVDEICRLTGGTPLALEMAAAWTPLMSCRQIADKIRENLDFLSNRRLDVPDRQRSVRALFEYSWSSLSLEEKRVFSWLSVFRGGAMFEEALKMTRADPEHLLRLVDKSLLHSNGAGRYFLHELVRQYAHERLQASGELEQASQRLYETYIELAETANRQLRRHGQEEWLDRLEMEHENLAATFDWSLYHQPDPHLPARLALALGWFWRIRSHTWEARHWFEQALQLGGLEVVERAGLLSFLGIIYWMQGDYAKVGQCLEESRKLYAGTMEREGLAYCLHSLGMLRFQQARYEVAREFFQSSLEMFNMDEDRWGKAFSLGWLGKCCDALGLFVQAEAASQECLAIFRQLGDRFGLALFLSNEARRLLNQGDLEQARCLAEEAVVLRREIGHQHSLGDAITILGEIATKRGEFGQARDYYLQAQVIFDNLGNQHYVDKLDQVIKDLELSSS